MFDLGFVPINDLRFWKYVSKIREHPTAGLCVQETWLDLLEGKLV